MAVNRYAEEAAVEVAMAGGSAFSLPAASIKLAHNIWGNKMSAIRTIYISFHPSVSSCGPEGEGDGDEASSPANVL